MSREVCYLQNEQNTSYIIGKTGAKVNVTSCAELGDVLIHLEGTVEEVKIAAEAFDNLVEKRHNGTTIAWSNLPDRDETALSMPTVAAPAATMPRAVRRCRQAVKPSSRQIKGHSDILLVLCRHPVHTTSTRICACAHMHANAHAHTYSPCTHSLCSHIRHVGAWSGADLARLLSCHSLALLSRTQAIATNTVTLTCSFSHGLADTASSNSSCGRHVTAGCDSFAVASSNTVVIYNIAGSAEGTWLKAQAHGLGRHWPRGYRRCTYL